LEAAEQHNVVRLILPRETGHHSQACPGAPITPIMATRPGERRRL
jgi:hypothetical protein